MRYLKSGTKRILSVVMTILLTISLLPASALTVWAEGNAGSFVLMALSEGQRLIGPVTITYPAGATVKEALLGSGYSFEGLAEEDWIHAVQGVTDSYVIYYDNEGYDLSVSADAVTGLWITGNYEQGYADSLLTLEKDLAAYLEAGDGRQNYEPLAQAAATALAGFWSADSATAASLDAALLSETENYLNIINSDTNQLALTVTKGGKTIASYIAGFTDAYGNRSSFAAGESIELTAGSYSYDISDGGINHCLGSLTVTEGTGNSLAVDLPASDWIASINLGLVSDWTEPVEKSILEGKAPSYYVPDYAGTSLYPYVVNASGVDTSAIRLYFGTDKGMGTARKSWSSHTSSVTNAVEKNSLLPSRLLIQAVKDNADGSQQMQEYDLEISRVATLSHLIVAAEGTQLPMDFDPDTTEYNLSTVSSAVDVKPELLCQDASVSVNGQTIESGSQKSISLKKTGTTDITVSTSCADGIGRDYVLHIEKKTSAEVVISHASGMETSLKNAAGSEIYPASTTGTKDTYHLTPGETYTWIGTKNTWYHTSGSFTAADGGKITAATPTTTDWISGMSAKSTTASTAVVYEMEPAFSAGVHQLKMLVGSTRTFVYLKTDLAITDGSLSAAYRNYQGTAVEKDIATGKFVNVASIVNQSGKGSDLLLTVKKAADSTGVTYYQEYQVTIGRSMELSALEAAASDGNSLVLVQDNGTEKNGFDKTVFSYNVGVKRSTAELTVSAKLYTSLVGKDQDAVITVASEAGSQEITYSDEITPDSLQSATVALNQNRNQEDVTVTISHPDERSAAQTYTIHVTKLEPAVTRITTIPADAVVFLTDDLSGERILPEEDGSYLLSETLRYNYVITAKGYISQSGSFVASRTDNEKTFVLEAAPETSYTDISGEDDWNSFRQGEENNGVTSAATPINSDDTVLVWANKIGEGYGSGATGCPILVGGYLYTYAGTSIVKVDKNTGEVVQSGVMAASSSFAINSPTYAAGMIFVGLSNGRVQAFNAETLESLWLYTDPLGGQANSTITYKDGYVYTGFWNGEAKTANFVCLSVTDEDPTQTIEAKQATWRYTDNGFYWAGAYATDNYVLVTTDDGATGSTTGYGSVVSLDPSTGRVLDSVKMPIVGDLRSSICYDAATDACYFTSKGGYFCKIRVNADGSFVENSLQTIRLENGSPDSTPMSTSTPTIYNGRAYIGVSGSGQFTPYSGHNITVIDLASWTIAYSVPTQGSPQTSGILTTAYEAGSQYVYVYFLDNYTPGKIRVIRDKPGQTALDPEYSTVETYTVKNQTYEVVTAYVLFTPSGSQAQYAICSPIVDADGNLYFKNDSAQLMKLSSTITSLEVTAGPVKTEYCQGQVFDPSGIRVTARYANGSSKDVTDCISFYQDPDWEISAETEALTADTEKIYLVYDQNKLLQGDTSYWTNYHDEAGEAGCQVPLSYTEVAVQVGAEHTDKNGDAYCDRCGATMIHAAVITQQPVSVGAAIGEKVTFTVGADYAKAGGYQWQYSKNGSSWSNSSIKSAKTETITITLSETNKANYYRCRITGTDGKNVYSKKVACVAITEQPADSTAIIGEKAAFSVQADNITAYQWYSSKDGGETWSKSTLSTAAKSTLTMNVTTTSYPRIYRCQLTDNRGIKVYTAAAGFREGIRIQTQPQNVKTVTGQKAVFSVVATGSDLSYSWQYSKDNGASWVTSTLKAAKTDILTTTVSADNWDGRLYRCVITDSYGDQLITQTAKLTVTKGPFILKQPSAVTTSLGKKISFSVEAVNVAADGYQWYYSKDGVKWAKSTIASAKTDTISITVSDSNKMNVYRCKLTGIDGSVVYTDTVSITVK